MPSANVAELLEEAAARTPERVALSAAAGGDPRSRIVCERVTYAELERRVERVAAALRGHGFAAGDRVLLFVPMSIPLYVLLLAVFRAGGVALFLDPWCTPEQMAHVCRLAEPRWFAAVPKAFLFLLRHRALRAVPRRLSTDPFPFGPRLTLPRLLREGGGDTAAAPRAAEDTAMVTFTSGTTGRPKGADRTHGFLRAQHDIISRVFGYRADDTDLSTFPVFTLNSLACGMTAVLPHMDFRRPADADPDWILRQLADERVTTMVGSPAFFDAVAGGVDDDRACRTVRTAFTGGGPVSFGTLRRMQRVFPNARVKVAYGSTEAEPIAHIDAEDVLATAADTAAGRGICVGRPIEDIACRLVPPRNGPLDEAGDVPAGDTGEIAVAGPHVCRSYYGDEDAVRRNKIRAPDGCVWHRTGDLARRDEAGRLWLVGRLSARIRRGNETWDPGCMEAAAGLLDGVRAVACVGWPRDGADQSLHLCWVPKAGAGEATETAIRALFADRGWPLDGVHRLAELPTDPRHNTKVDRARLRARLERQQGGAG